MSIPMPDATAGGAAGAAEQALLRQKNLYAVLSQTNKAIIHLVGRDELFAAVCRIAVEQGRVRFAWVRWGRWLYRSAKSFRERRECLEARPYRAGTPLWQVRDQQ